MPWARGFIALILILLGAACADSSAPVDAPDGNVALASTYGQIQRNIFDRQCVSCHSTNGSAAAQSGLILEPAVSYQNLIGIRPSNTNAQNDGLARVLPGNPAVSLLFHKLNWNPQHHAGRNYGNPMPLGGEAPNFGVVEFVRRWIAAGAPRTGFVADSTLLRDSVKQYVEDFRPLPLPASGFQLRVDSFNIQPNFERELFQYRRVGNTQDVFVNRVETRMRLNGHHLLMMTFRDSTPANIYPQPDIVRDIRAANGDMLYQNMLVMGWHQYFAGSNTPYEDKRLPEGTALKLPANVLLDLNTHFINYSTRPGAGEVYINLHTVPASQVRNVVRPFYLMHDTFELPPNQRTTVTRTFLFDRPTTLLMLTSHNHELGERFEIRIAGGARNGERIYTSLDWKHPLIMWLPQPIILQAGEGLTSIVTYNNSTGRTIRHGLLTTDEMDIMRGYAY
ncbi:MAG: hypothetical protein ACREMA_01980 [Longimicrobiales bacterium]